MYLKEILTYLGWPVMLFVTYKIVVWAIKFYEKKYQINPSENDE